MIELTVPLEGAWHREEPFAVRLRRDGPVMNAEGRIAVLPDGTIGVDCEHGSFRLKHPLAAQEIEGEVLAVYPGQNRAVRLIRSGKATNTILLTEECDQLCVMCSQPPKARRYDHFALYADAVRLAPKGAVIGISGGEPTLLKEQLFDWLQRMIDVRPDILFHILSNAQHFEPSDHAALVLQRDHVLWGIPLYGADRETHDPLVGKAGAFDRLLQSLDICARAGSMVELRTVIMQQNLPALPRLAGFVARHLQWVRHWAIMQLEYQGYARLNWTGIFADTSLHFAPIAAAIRIAETARITVSLFNFPRCTVPPPFRSVAAASISDWKQKYLAVCGACSERAACGGFFHWYPEEHGFQRIEPL